MDDGLFTSADIAPELLVYGPGDTVRQLRDVGPDESFKRCKGPCRRNKLLSEFTPNQAGRGGRSSWCRCCHAEHALQQYHADPEAKKAAMRERYAAKSDEINAAVRAARKADPERYRGHDLKKCFRLTLDQYWAIFDRQGGGCAICGEPPNGERNRPRTNLAVDHDHRCCDADGKSCGSCIRGLLCRACNTGHFDDDPVLMLKATIYVLWWRREHRKASDADLLLLKNLQGVLLDRA